LERSGLPSVSVIADEFRKLALTKRDSMGMPHFQPVFFSHTSAERLHSADDARHLAEAAFEKVVNVLTGGLGAV
jgi:hypothetical protein